MECCETARPGAVQSTLISAIRMIFLSDAGFPTSELLAVLRLSAFSTPLTYAVDAMGRPGSRGNSTSLRRPSASWPLA
jgi:hypothetical protein